MKIRAKSYCNEQVQVFGLLDVWGQSLDVSVLQYVLKKMQLYINFPSCMNTFLTGHQMNSLF